MNITFSLEQISKTGNLDSNLILGQNKLDLMARFIYIKSVNSKLRQDQIAKDLGCSSSTLLRYRQDITMLSPNKIPTSSYKRRRMIPNICLDNKSHREHDLKRQQLTSNDIKKPKTFSTTYCFLIKQIERWIHASDY